MDATSDGTTAAAHDVVNDAITYSRDTLGSSAELGTLERRYTTIFDTFATTDTALAAIRDDRRLSQEGRTEKQQVVKDHLETTVTAALAEAEEALSGLQARTAERLKLPPPTSDPVVLEVKLGNARSDARMLFDKVETQGIPARLLQLAEQGLDPEVAYLLLETPWMQTYLQTREAPTHVTKWWKEAVEDARKRFFLDADGRRVSDALNRLEKARWAARTAWHFYRANRGL